MSWLFLLPLLCQDPGVPERQAGILGCSQMPEPRLLLMSEAGAELSFGIFWQSLVYLQGFAKPSLFPVLSEPLPTPGHSWSRWTEMLIPGFSCWAQ